jgi:hypothetical protein
MRKERKLRISELQGKGKKMAQDASGLTQGARKLTDTFEGWINKIPTPSKRVDTSGHDKMVADANEGFRKRAEKKRKAVGGAANKGMVAKRKATPKTTPKKVSEKR